MLKDYKKLSSILQKKTTTYSNIYSIFIASSLIVLFASIMNMLDRTLLPSNDNYWSIREDGIIKTKSYIVILCSIFCLIKLDAYYKLQNKKKLYRQLKNNNSVKHIFKLKKYNYNQPQSITFAEFLHMHDLKLQPNQYTPQQTSALIKASKQITVETSWLALILSYIKVMFILTIITEKTTGFFLPTISNTAFKSTQEYCLMINDFYTVLNGIGKDRGFNFPRYDCAFSKPQTMGVYNSLQTSQIHSPNTQKPLIALLIKSYSNELKQITAKSYSAYTHLQLARLWRHIFTYSGGLIDLLCMRAYTHEVLADLILLGFSLLSLATYVGLFISYCFNKIQQCLSTLIINELKHISLGVGIKIRKLTYNLEYGTLEVSFLKDQPHAKKIFAFLLKIFNHTAYGITLDTNPLSTLFTIMRYETFPISEKTCALIYKRIQNQSQFAEEISAILSHITTYNKNLMEISFNHKVGHASTEVIINCRLMGRREFRLNSKAITNALDANPHLSKVNLNPQCLEIVITLPLTCTTENLRLWNKQQQLRHNQKIKNIPQTIFHNSNIYATTAVHNKKPLIKINSKHPIVIKTKHFQSTHALINPSLETLRQHHSLSSCIPMILRLLDNNILPPGQCSGSGFVYISKCERHKGTLLQGEAKIKLKHNNISWRICLTKIASIVDENITTYTYSIVAIYQKNNKHMDRIQQSEKTTSARSRHP